MLQAILGGKTMRTGRLARAAGVLTVVSTVCVAGVAFAGQPMDPQTLVRGLASAEPATRIDAAARLAEVDGLIKQPDLLRAAVAAMGDPEEEVRFLAVSAVAASAYGTDPAKLKVLAPAMSGLIERLDDPADRIKEAAANTLALLGTPPRATADLLGLLDTSSSSAVRGAVIDALARLPVVDGAVRGALIDALRTDADATVRGEAAKAIAAHRLDDAEAVDALRQALGDSDAYVLQNAVRALGMLGDRAAAAVPDLDELAARTDREVVRKQVGYALRSIRGERGGSLDREGPTVRSEPMESEAPRQPAGSAPPPR